MINSNVTTREKRKAMLEVLAIFALTFVAIIALGISPVGVWERQVTSYPFFEYALMISIPIGLLLALSRNLAQYGIDFRHLRYHLNIALTCFIPFAMVNAVGELLGLKIQTYPGTLFHAACGIGLLFIYGWLLRKKTDATTLTMAGSLSAAILLLPAMQSVGGPSLGKAAFGFAFYLLFLGPGEEILFRGFMLSRLDVAFGRPFRFWGANWGWGVFIVAALFGLMHVLNVYSLVLGNWQISPWWGFATFFSSFGFAFLREKTGSIFAPAVVHGLPQAIYSAFLSMCEEGRRSQRRSK